jgi:hypothetical protein
MSDLVLSAQFVRMGSNPFGPKPKDVPVFAQLLVGGSGLWIFTNTSDSHSSPSSIRIRCESSSELDVLRAGFAIVDTNVPNEGSAKVIDRLRKSANSGGDIEVSPAEAADISQAVSGLYVHLHVTLFNGVATFDDTDAGDWRITTSAVEV